MVTITSIYTDGDGVQPTIRFHDDSELDFRERSLPLHRAEAGWPRCATCDGGGCPDCTDASGDTGPY